MLLEFDPEVTAIAAQPLWLHWRDGAGRSRRHAPVGAENLIHSADQPRWIIGTHTSKLQVPLAGLRGPVVLLDHAAEDLPAAHRRIKGHDDWLVMIGVAAAAGTDADAARYSARVSPQHRPQMSFAIDQHPVRALGPYRPHPAFGITIGPHRQRHLVQMIGTGVCG
jgi:hypothetical protein